VSPGPNVSIQALINPYSAIGFSNWIVPGPFVAYRAQGNLGKFLGVWTSMNQVRVSNSHLFLISLILQVKAIFSFFGTEIPAVAAGEVRGLGLLSHPSYDDNHRYRILLRQGLDLP